jgi:hypothetical protein
MGEAVAYIQYKEKEAAVKKNNSVQRKRGRVKNIKHRLR